VRPIATVQQKTRRYPPGLYFQFGHLVLFSHYYVT
jgi:hypothetical protein